LSGGATNAAEQNTQIEEDAARYGIPLELLQEAVGNPQESFEIWPENNIALGIFLRCTTQFRYRRNGEREQICGIDYSALESILRIHSIENAPEVFEDIRAMELAIVEKINEN
jgi:hypothetical protein